MNEPPTAIDRSKKNLRLSLQMLRPDFADLIDNLNKTVQGKHSSPRRGAPLSQETTKTVVSIETPRGLVRAASARGMDSPRMYSPASSPRMARAKAARMLASPRSRCIWVWVLNSPYGNQEDHTNYYMSAEKISEADYQKLVRAKASNCKANGDLDTRHDDAFVIDDEVQKARSEAALLFVEFPTRGSLAEFKKEALFIPPSSDIYERFLILPPSVIN